MTALRERSSMGATIPTAPRCTERHPNFCCHTGELPFICHCYCLCVLDTSRSSPPIISLKEYSQQVVPYDWNVTHSTSAINLVYAAIWTTAYQSLCLTPIGIYTFRNLSMRSNSFTNEAGSAEESSRYINNGRKPR